MNKESILKKIEVENMNKEILLKKIEENVNNYINSDFDKFEKEMDSLEKERNNFFRQEFTNLCNKYKMCLAYGVDDDKNYLVSFTHDDYRNGVDYNEPCDNLK